MRVIPGKMRDPEPERGLQLLSAQGKPLCPKIAVVDDEPAVLKSIQRVFMDDSVNVDLFDTPLRAMDAMCMEEYAVVLSDQRMPELTGIQFLSKVSAAHPDTVCIMLSSYADVATVLDAVNQVKVYKFLSKPWVEDELRLAVHNALEHYRFQTENKRHLALTLEQNALLRDMNAHLDSQMKSRTAEISLLLDTKKRTFIQTIRTLTELVEFYDPLIVCHMRRVAEWIEKLAPRLVFDEEDIQDAVVSALLHDIGLVGIPRSILKRPEGELSRAECVQMRQHPEQAFVILNHIVGFQQVARIVRSHHECYDGTGYPDSLKGKKIPLLSRMIHLVSDFDHMISKLKAAPQEAAEMLVERSGQAYDPEVVAQFMAMLSESNNHDYIEAVSVPDLKDGLVLARDVVATNGKLLLTRECILKNTHIQTLHRLSDCSMVIEPLYVYRKNT